MHFQNNIAGQGPATKDITMQLSDNNPEVGKKFGLWVVKARCPKLSTGPTMWLCRCACGVERNIVGANLKRGTTKSCGCFRVSRKLLPGIEC